MSKSISILWLKIACLITIAVGFIAAFASYPATSGLWLGLFDVLKWPFDGNPSAFNEDTRAVNAVLGGVMVGWGLMMFLLTQNSTLINLPQIPKIMMYSLFVWFVVDSTGSFFANLSGNILLNINFLLIFLPPLHALIKQNK